MLIALCLEGFGHDMFTLIPVFFVASMVFHAAQTRSRRVHNLIDWPFSGP